MKVKKTQTGLEAGKEKVVENGALPKVLERICDIPERLSQRAHKRKYVAAVPDTVVQLQFIRPVEHHPPNTERRREKKAGGQSVMGFAKSVEGNPRLALRRLPQTHHKVWCERVCTTALSVENVILAVFLCG